MVYVSTTPWILILCKEMIHNQSRRICLEKRCLLLTHVEILLADILRKMSTFH